MDATFNRKLLSGETIQLEAETVSPPKSKFLLSGSASACSWSAVAEHGASSTVSFTIFTPPTASIGRYTLSAHIISGGRSYSIQLGKFILLFNPWCKDDDVFMPTGVERKEYVLSDSGIIYRGNYKSITELGWNFGQFEENILDLCLTILDKSFDYCNQPSMDCAQRNNPVHVSRVISSMVNCQDDEGVLEGDWSGDYEDGVSPAAWNGSVAILQKWRRNGYKPVQYGQCWVFAGVTCTVLRCLGIPARVITNFSSAHDTNGNLCIDEYYDKSGTSLNKGEDSIWNFHVWNEGWFVRKDLGSFYDGWQILDATPQEQSAGLYCCGPTSVKAIKEGDVHLNYDAPFVYAEVNADRVSWIWHSQEQKERLTSDVCIVGKNISTKALGQNSREDITDNYKYEDGSKKEREMFTKAYGKLFGPAAPPPPSCRFADSAGMNDPGNSTVLAKPKVSGAFKITQTILYGEDVNLVLILKNSSTDQATHILVNISASSTLYTGKVMSEIMKKTTSVILGPKEEKEIPFKVTYKQYENYLTSDLQNFNISAVCEVVGEEKILVQRYITLESPPIRIKILGPVVVNKPGKAEVTFCNLLSEKLTKGKLLVVGATLLREAVEKTVDIIQPKETITILIDFSPIAVGKKQLSVDFSCNKFCNVKSFVEILVVAD
ncbi:protein-glutamine gamma-glutamyltransferase E-like isoform X2 [Ambystoma mexicanum]